MTLPDSRPSPPRPEGQGKLQREMAALLSDIAGARADLARQADLLRDLHGRLDQELRPWEAKLASARRETLNILGGHCREGWLPRRDGVRLREALRGLADELEAGFGLDLSEERRRFLDPAGAADGEAEGRSGAEREGREARLDALRAAIGDENGPREAAARAKRERMDDLREALKGGHRPEPGRRGPAGEAGDPGPEPKGRKDREPGGDDPGREGRPGGESRARRKEAEEETAFAGDLRALYLLLARALHPDKEGDPARREAKTAWMQKVTAAYGARDLAKLLDILASDPLGSVGPYLSSAPLAAVKGFAKRLRRELAALRAKAETGRAGVHPSLRKFLGPRGIDEAEVKRYAAALKKEVRFVKERNQWYRERSAVEEMLKAMGGDWRGYL